MTTKTMTQAAYARHRGISPARVSILIRDGKISPECYETMANGRRKINVKKADQALSENLDQLYNPRRETTAAQIKAQDAASDFATVEDEDGKWLYPTGPWWELRYLIKLLELSPDQIETFKYENSKGSYLIKVTDHSPEEPGPFPWSVELTFKFGE